MRSSLIFVALCLGLASAAPATDLLRSLLKRQYLPEVDPLPEDGGDKKLEVNIMPTKEELGAMSALGYAIEFLTAKAAESPEEFLAYMKSFEEADAENNPEKPAFDKDGNPIAVPYEMEKRRRGGRGGRGGRQGGGRGRGGRGGRQGGRGGRGGRQSSEEEASREGQMKEAFMEEVMQKGVYKTVIRHVGMMATMLKHSPAIFEHMMKGPDCQDCPDLPEEVMEIIMGEGSEESSEESSEEGPYQMAGKRPNGYGRPGGNSDEVDSAFGQIPNVDVGFGQSAEIDAGFGVPAEMMKRMAVALKKMKQ